MQTVSDILNNLPTNQNISQAERRAVTAVFGVGASCQAGSACAWPKLRRCDSAVLSPVVLARQPLQNANILMTLEHIVKCDNIFTRRTMATSWVRSVARSRRVLPSSHNLSQARHRHTDTSAVHSNLKHVQVSDAGRVTEKKVKTQATLLTAQFSHKFVAACKHARLLGRRVRTGSTQDGACLPPQLQPPSFLSVPHKSSF